MKKRHIHKLKFHTIFTLVITTIFIFVLLLSRDISLTVAMIFLCVYIAGNGIIHIRHNELSKDTIIEYLLIAAIAAVLFIGSLKYLS